MQGMQSLGQDLRFGLHMLGKNPGFSLQSRCCTLAWSDLIRDRNQSFSSVAVAAPGTADFTGPRSISAQSVMARTIRAQVILPSWSKPCCWPRGQARIVVINVPRYLTS